MNTLERTNEKYSANIPHISDEKPWNNRREEILNLFRENVYGYTPKYNSNTTKCILKDESVTDFGVLKRCYEAVVTINENTFNIPFTVFMPSDKTKVKAFLHICKQGQLDTHNWLKDGDDGFFPIENIINHGYAAILLKVDDFCPDDPENQLRYQEGLYKLFNFDENDKSHMKAIGTWAFAASRVLDCIKNIAEIDETNVAVIGHSRFGKTALWTAAQDERFKMAVSNNSGCTGAAISRIKIGESVEFINKQFTYWFCEKYAQYGDKVNTLPVDQHMLLALIAPRLLCVSSSSLDDWADPNAEYTSTVIASEFYAEQFGYKPLKFAMPAENVAQQTDNISYHVKTGPHSLTFVDWDIYLNFADQHM